MVLRRMSFLIAGSTMMPTDCSRSHSSAPVNAWLSMLPAAKYVTFSLVSGSFRNALTSNIFGVRTSPKTRKNGGHGGHGKQQQRCRKTAHFHFRPHGADHKTRPPERAAKVLGRSPCCAAYLRDR